MVIKLLKGKQKRTKENPYSIFLATTKKHNEPADTREHFDAKPNGICYTSPVSSTPDKDEDMVRELVDSRLSTPQKQFAIALESATEGSKTMTLSRQLSRQLSRSDRQNLLSSGEQVDGAAESESETPKSYKPSRISSADSFESLFKPKNNVNRLLTSCAMSNVRNSLIVSGVAAAFYNGGWLPSSAEAFSDQSIFKLNEYIAEVRAEVDSGLPGRDLTIVIGSQLGDLDSVVSTVTYAYFLHRKRQQDEQCFVPVINMKRRELQIHSEVAWLFKSVALDVQSLIFADEISFSYYYRFGNLRLVLVDHSQLEPAFEIFETAVGEVLDPAVSDEPNGAMHRRDQVGSCCTLVAERFAAEAPDLLFGRGLSRLLLAGILMDTSNLDPSIGHCSGRDISMATLVLNGAGRYGRNGFFKMLRKKVSDLSVLSPREILNKDIKQWVSRTDSSDKPVRVGLSSIGVSLGRFLTVETGVADEFTYLRKSRKLDILLVVTVYYDKRENFKREVLFVADKDELINSLVEFYNSESMKLQALNIIGLGPGMKAFLLGNFTISRAQIVQLTDTFIKQC